MKIFLMILGGIFGVLILSLVGFVTLALFSEVGPELDSESKAWVDTLVPEIISTWDENKFKENANYRLLEVIGEEAVPKLFSTFRDQFGDFKEYKGSEGEAGIRINNKAKTITAEYIAEADFENGLVRIEIQGIKENDEWTILRFFMTPIAEQKF